MKYTCLLRFLLVFILGSEATAQTNRKISLFNRNRGKSTTTTQFKCKEHPLEGMLLVADGSSIRSFNTNGEQHKVHANIGGTSIDYDCMTREIFWSDYINTNEVYVLKDGDTSLRSVLRKSNNWIPTSIAVDSVTNKIYVADGSSETVSLYDVVSGKFTVIVNSNLTGVFNLDVDLEDGYLFIQDEFQIIRTDLDGANRRILDIKTNKARQANRNNRVPSTNANSSNKTERLSITRMTVDLQTKRIYWADGVNREVVSFNYHGEDRKVHFQDNNRRNYQSFGSITILDGFLYWSNGESNHIFKIDLNGKRHSEFTLKNKSVLNIKAVSCSKAPQIANPCRNNNGRCQDLCVMSKSSKNNFKCFCNIGYKVANDDKSCSHVQEYIIFSMEEKLRGMSITKRGKQSVDVIDPVAIEMSNQAYLDINAKDKVVYYNSPNQLHDLYQLRLNDGSKNILASGLHIPYRTRLAFDWASRNLYFFNNYEEGWMALNVLNVDNPSFIKTIGAILPNTCKTDIVVHPNRGYLYYSQNINEYSKIRRASLNGSNPSIIYETFIKYVPAMAIDLERDRLYWIEVLDEDMQDQSSGSEIRHSDLAGRDIKKISFRKGNKLNLKSIAIHGDFIYAIESDAAIIRFNKFGNSGNILTLADSAINPSASGLKIFSLGSQTPKTDHPCALGHHCMKFCFAVPKVNGGIEGICGCPQNELLANDGKSCIKLNKILQQIPYISAPAA